MNEDYDDYPNSGNPKLDRPVENPFVALIAVLGLIALLTSPLWF
jgi:hypothetical protein